MPLKNQRVSVKASIEKKHKFLNDTSRKQKTLLSSPDSKKTKKPLDKNSEKEMIKSENDMNHLDKDTTHLKQKMAELEEQIAFLENACHWIDRENNQLRTQRDCLESENRTLKNELSVNNVRSRVSIALQKLKLKTPPELLKENDDLNQRCETLQTQIKQLETQKDEKLKQTAHQHEDFLKLQQTFENTIQKNENLNALINQLRNERNTLKESESIHKNQLITLTKKVGTLTHSAADKEKKIVELEQNSELLKNKLTFSSDQIQQLENMKKKRMSQHEAVHHLLEKKLIERNNEIDYLKNKLARSQKDYSQLNVNYDSLKLEKKSELKQIKNELDMKTFNQVPSNATTHGVRVMHDTNRDISNSTSEIFCSPPLNPVRKNSYSSEDSSISSGYWSSSSINLAHNPSHATRSSINSPCSRFQKELGTLMDPNASYNTKKRYNSTPHLFLSSHPLSQATENRERPSSPLKAEVPTDQESSSPAQNQPTTENSLHEIQKKLETELFQRFTVEYNTTLTTFYSDKNKPLLDCLLDLNSEQEKRQRLAENTTAALLNNDHSNAQLTSLWTEINNSHDSPAATKVLIDSFITNGLLSPANDLLSSALEENKENAPRLIELSEELTDTFRQDNHARIMNALTQAFVKKVTAFAERSLLMNSDMHIAFDAKLQKKATHRAKQLTFELSTKPHLFCLIIEKINNNNLRSLAHLNKVEQLAPYIFDSLELGGKDYNSYIIEVSTEILIDCCIETLQRDERANFIKIAENLLNHKASDHGLRLDPNQQMHTITQASQEAVTELLEETSAKKSILPLIKNNPLNLLETSKQLLQKQLRENIDQRFEYYLPNLHLDPIFKKINTRRISSFNTLPEGSMDSILTDTERSTFPIELQYADSPTEFITNLQLKYPYFCSQAHHQFDQEIFKALRLMLRKKALETLHKTFPEDKNIDTCDATRWLEKKLRLITNQPIKLILDAKRQKKLDQQFKKQFHLTPLTDEAITHQSVDALKTELNKLHTFQNKLLTKRDELLSEIESKLSIYPRLVEEKDSDRFKTHLNDVLSATSMSVDSVQVKILLEKINCQLGNNKWAYLNKNLIEIITCEILASNATLFPFNKKNILTQVEKTLNTLSKFYHLQETQQKREQWKIDIQWLFAFRKKLESLNHSLYTRIAKLENMQKMKETDVASGHETVTSSTTPGAVYIPHHCCVVADVEPSISPTSFFSVKSDAFYKQNALEVNQKLTFEQTLSNKEKCTWSVTRADDKSLFYETYQSWKNMSTKIKDYMGYQTTYVNEISFSQMIHAINSFKNGSICTLQIGQCSVDMEKKLQLFIAAYNELRHTTDPLLICNFNSELDIQPSEIELLKTEIKNKLKLQSHELDTITKQLCRPVHTVSRFR